MTGAARWWREAIVYQIWPKSFYSAKNTATGDIAGIIAKLDYIKSLGANTIWLSPHYPSPMHDEGYDISDYENVNPLFGTLEEAEQLIKECHARDMKIIFDLVINHTSDQHKWFQESRSSKDNPKADWYIWKPARYDEDGNRKPPTNWSSCFAQSAWSWDETRQEYYLHLFAIEQPDLNFRNEECRKEIYRSAIEFWLERGLDGFRVDTVNLYSKPEKFVDVPVTNAKSEVQGFSPDCVNGPEIHKYVNEIGLIMNKYDAMTVGELGSTPNPQMVHDYVSLARNELSMVFGFDIVTLGRAENDWFDLSPFKLTQVTGFVETWQKFIEGTDSWTTSYLENHDQGRGVSRFASDAPQHRAQSSKLLSLMILGQSGTPFIYQGQELGMTNVPVDWPEEEYLDIMTINYLAKLRKEGVSEEKIKQKVIPMVNLVARDNSRTPVQWSDEGYAGFSQSKPWMRVNDNYKEINAAQQLSDPDSPYHFWQKAIKLRKQHTDLFTYGTFQLVDRENEKVFSFIKTAENGSSSSNNKAFFVLNFSKDSQAFTLPSEFKGSSPKQTLYSRSVKSFDEDLEAYEGRVLLF